MYTCKTGCGGRLVQHCEHHQIGSGMLGVVALPLDIDRPRQALQHTGLCREIHIWCWRTYRCVWGSGCPPRMMMLLCSTKKPSGVRGEPRSFACLAVSRLSDRDGITNNNVHSSSKSFIVMGNLKSKLWGKFLVVLVGFLCVSIRLITRQVQV